jgi:hypothetical protein
MFGLEVFSVDRVEVEAVVLNLGGKEQTGRVQNEGAGCN